MARTNEQMLELDRILQSRKRLTLEEIPVEYKSGGLVPSKGYSYIFEGDRSIFIIPEQDILSVSGNGQVDLRDEVLTYEFNPVVLSSSCGVKK